MFSLLDLVFCPRVDEQLVRKTPGKQFWRLIAIPCFKTPSVFLQHQTTPYTASNSAGKDLVVTAQSNDLQMHEVLKLLRRTNYRIGVVASEFWSNEIDESKGGFVFDLICF